MADFKKEHKAEMGKYFSDGIFKVTILEVSGGVNQNDNEYIEFVVGDDEGREGTARVWLTSDKAIGFAFNTIRNLFVHNAPKGKEEAAKDIVNKVENSDQLIDLCNKTLIGKEAWYMVETSEYTYTNLAGELKHGKNRNIFGYEPKPKQSGNKVVDEVMGGGTVISEEEVPSDL